MEALKEFFPVTKSFTSAYYDHSTDPWFKQRYSSSLSENNDTKSNPVPLYNTSERLKHRLSEPKDFGDGGALPEIHYAQYPLDMGRKKDTKKYVSKTLPVTIDEHGGLVYDAIVKQNEKFVQSQYKDLVPKILKDEDVEEQDVEKQKVIDETTLRTKQALEKIINERRNVQTQSQEDSKFIKYRPSENSVSFNSGAKERIIRMVEMGLDPLEPPKFKHKKVPKGNGSVFVPVLHSPPRGLTFIDQKNWKIPACISNWKNPKGYTIPLDKRLAADVSRGIQDVQVNDNFAKLSESLYVLEHKAREDLEFREKVHKEMMMREIERKEKELRDLAQKARRQRAEEFEPEKENDEKKLERDEIRKERRRERRLNDGEMAKKRKISRDRGRDVSEKMALGLASVGLEFKGEVMYDQRLFNQEKGTGFGNDDQYNVYDKGLFTAQNTLSTLYKPKKDADEEMYGDVDEVKIRPVEFEKGVSEDVDIFGLDKILTEVTGGRKKPREGTMRASR